MKPKARKLWAYLPPSMSMENSSGPISGLSA